MRTRGLSLNIPRCTSCQRPEKWKRSSPKETHVLARASPNSESEASLALHLRSFTQRAEIALAMTHRSSSLGVQRGPCRETCLWKVGLTQLCQLQKEGSL